MNKWWILILIGIALLLVGIYFLINADYASETAKSTGGLKSVRSTTGSRKPCTPKQIAELAQRNAAGTLSLPYPCDTAGVNFGDMPTAPEWRFAAAIGGVQPFVSRESCGSYGFAALGAKYANPADRKRYEEEVCGWRRGRPGCSYADRFRYSP